MPIEFRPAAIDGVALFIAVAGASRSGKTFTALRLARGIVGPHGRIAAIDTEAKRMSHYKNDFLDGDGRPFDVWNMEAPFAPQRFLEAAKKAQKAGFGVLVIDSFSLEWVGEGGVLDWHEKELDAAVERATKRGDDRRSEYQIREAAKMAAWIKPKSAHKAMMNGFLQLTMPIIFCLRAEDKVKPTAGGKPEKLGWIPTQDPRFIYEWTVSLTLHPDTPGKIRYDLPHKVEGQHKALFPEGKLVGEEAGAALYAWANQDAAARQAAPSPPPPDDVRARKAREFADQLIASIEAAPDAAALHLVTRHPATLEKLGRLREDHAAQHARVEAAIAARTRGFGPPQETAA